MSGTGGARQYVSGNQDAFERYFGDCRNDDFVDGADAPHSEVLSDIFVLEEGGAPQIASALRSTWEKYQALRRQINALYEENPALWEALHELDRVYAGDNGRDQLPEMDRAFSEERSHGSV